MPDRPFHNFIEPQNPSHEVRELHKIRRSPEFETMALLKSWSGRLGFAQQRVVLQRKAQFVLFPNKKINKVKSIVFICSKSLLAGSLDRRTSHLFSSVKSHKNYSTICIG